MSGRKSPAVTARGHRQRKTKEREYLLSLVVQGLSIPAACKIVGITKASIYQERKRNPDYKQRLADSLLKGKATTVSPNNS